MTLLGLNTVSFHFMYKINWFSKILQDLLTTVWNNTFFTFSLFIEGATEKVS
jgi:hypothetical protein